MVCISSPRQGALDVAVAGEHEHLHTRMTGEIQHLFSGDPLRRLQRSRATAPPTPPSGTHAVVRCLSPGPGLPGGTVSAVRLPAWRPARRPAAGTRARLGGVGALRSPGGAVSTVLWHNSVCISYRTGCELHKSL